ncbi:flagellar biosynthetic protein FliR [Actibacterium ureilyticum]|uniref:flagellar biosynthetic protein FliR n=1 Tax=Actibacterium ureilyticum TaxID=1590614 RepID=UPI000BAAC32A|nr:flagellar biosynthetic protein FliR [Actibacterium ureilyticum]
MSNVLADILSNSQQLLALAFAVFLRVGAAMAMVPGFGERMIPRSVRLGIALAFSAAILPAVAQSAGLADVNPLAPGFLAAEVMAGLAFGLILRIMVMVLQMAGSIAAQSTSLAQILGGAATDPQPAIAHLLLLGGLALAMMSGLHLRITEALILSYDAIPAGTGVGAAILSEWTVAHVARGFALAVTLAIPFVIAAFLYNLALGVINRAMPQLMVAFVGAPALTAGGLILLALAAPLMLQLWSVRLDALLRDPFGGAMP